MKRPAMKRPIVPLLIPFVGLVAAGCAGRAKPPDPAPSSSSQAVAPGKPINAEALRRDLMNFSDRFSSSIAAAYDDLAGKVPAADAKNVATERKLNNVAAAYMN